MARTRGLGWSVGAAVLLAVGMAVRLALGGTGVGNRSALIMGLLLTAAAWLAARLLAGPRPALFVTLAAVALLDVAALPPRDPAPYDDLQAFYRTDQRLTAEVAAPPSGTSTLSLLVQPVFSGEQPHFGLAGAVNGTQLTWTCTFAHGVQWIALPVSVNDKAAKVELHLTGSPSRDGDYLIVYASSRQGGYLISLGSPDQSATRCSAA